MGLGLFVLVISVGLGGFEGDGPGEPFLLDSGSCIEGAPGANCQNLFSLEGGKGGRYGEVGLKGGRNRGAFGCMVATPGGLAAVGVGINGGMGTCGGGSSKTALMKGVGGGGPFKISCEQKGQESVLFQVLGARSN